MFFMITMNYKEKAYFLGKYGYQVWGVREQTMNRLMYESWSLLGIDNKCRTNGGISLLFLAKEKRMNIFLLK